MYGYLFEAKFLTLCAALVCAGAASAAAGDARLWWRGVLFAFGPIMAAAFFLVAMVGPVPVSLPDVIGGFCLEFAVLVGFYGLLRKLLAILGRCRDEDVSRLVVATLALQLILSIPLITSEGFGIFSEGSRIDYLYAGSIAKYLTYAGVLLSGLQIPLLAHRISRRRVSLLDLIVIVATFAASVLAGSKGSVFLWLIAISALVDYGKAGISWRAALLTLGALGSAIVVSSILISEFLGVSMDVFADLALNRFFLVNDARALAFDYRSGRTPDVGLLSETFRSVSTLFGAPPTNPPLGVLLYGHLLGFESGNGANASLAALLIYFSHIGDVALLGPIAAMGGVAIAVFFVALARSMRLAATRAAVLVLGIFCLQQYSQDFLAFQVVAPLAILTIFIVWLYDTKYGRPSRARSSFKSAAAASERRYSGA